MSTHIHTSASVRRYIVSACGATCSIPTSLWRGRGAARCDGYCCGCCAVPAMMLLMQTVMQRSIWHSGTAHTHDSLTQPPPAQSNHYNNSYCTHTTQQGGGMSMHEVCAELDYTTQLHHTVREYLHTHPQHQYTSQHQYNMNRSSICILIPHISITSVWHTAIEEQYLCKHM